MRPHLMEAVRVAIANSSPPPTNEADTCFQIIQPLLLAASYGYKEIKSQGPDATKGKPDFTILPDDDAHTWFLEAKGWNETLDNVHAQQALNYVNTQGKRWVVLTNGRSWRLYDNAIFGTAEDKLAAEFSLKDKLFSSFLEAISKPSVVGGKLESFVQNQRLYATLSSQIAIESSQVVRAVLKVLRNQTGLKKVAASQIVRFFQERGNEAPIEIDALPAPVRQAQTPGKKSSQIALAKVTREAVTHRTPRRLHLSDGHVIDGGDWRELTVGLVGYLLPRGLAELVPLPVGKKTKRAGLAIKGSSAASDIVAPREVKSANGTYVVEAHFSGNGHVRLWRWLLTQAGQPVEGASLELAE